MPEKILLVDDDRDFRSEFKDCFDEYEIIESASGEEALKILKKPNEIDLVVLDVKLPGLDGTEVLREIKKNNPGLGIIILTGFGSKDVVVEALRAGADDYLEKPFDVDAAKKIIENILEVKKSSADFGSGGIKGKLEHAKRFIQRNVHKHISLSDVASVIYLSPKYLSRIFKEKTGVRFNEYRLSIKIDEAIKLLTKTDYNISQIAERLAYENIESFIRQFKKRTGFTPSEYRMQNKRKHRKR
jgi:YesN/AraC family two-component response regulator